VPSHAADRHSGNGSQDLGGVTIRDLGDLAVTELPFGADEGRHLSSDQNLVEDGAQRFDFGGTVGFLCYRRRSAFASLIWGRGGAGHRY
jgi:hypothetical protein